jgi:hypothetical protein
VLAVLVGFENYLLKKRKYAPLTITTQVGLIRTAVREARKAGLPAPDIDEPREQYAPGSLMDVLLSGKTPLSVKTRRSAYKKFAASCEFDSAEYMTALDALIKMERVAALDALARFERYLSKLKYAPLTTANLIGKIRAAVRNARDAGLTTLDIDDPNAPAGPLRHTVARQSETLRSPAPLPWPELVIVKGPTAAPVVLGRHKTPLKTKARYMVIQALLKAGPGGLGWPQLQKVSGDAWGVLDRLRKSDPDWAAVIKFPMRSGGGNYRIGRQ